MHSYKSKFFSIFAASLLLAFASVAAVAAPPNDNFAGAETLNGIRVSVLRTNVGATKETAEPEHANDPGGKSVWFKWTAPFNREIRISTARTAENMATLIGIYTGTSMETLEPVDATSNIDASNNRSNVEFPVIQGRTYYIAVDGRFRVEGVTEGEFRLDIMPVFRSYGADYDRDGIANIAVWRPSAGTFFHYKPWTGETVYTLWGTNGDIPVVGGETDMNHFGIFRPSEGTFYMRGSGCCVSDLSYRWGVAGDVPFFDNFLGEEGIPAVFRPSEGNWYISRNGGVQIVYNFGQAGDIAVPGHYSANNVLDLAVFRPSDGTWHVLERSTSDGLLDRYIVVRFGANGDIPIPGDYDGDGILDIAVFRPSSGTFWVRSSRDGAVSSLRWGQTGDIPQSGDFDGDGLFDFAVYRPSNNVWYIYHSGDGSYTIREFGLPGDIPVASNRAQN